MHGRPLARTPEFRMSGRTRPARGAARRRVAAWAAAALAGCAAVTLIGHSRITTRISWHTDIKPIVDRHCVSCHTTRDQPVSLESYQDARPWARAIREEVLERRMPPWYARPGGARFANDRRLSPVEIDLLVAWADGGAPEGKPVGQALTSQPAAAVPADPARDRQSQAAEPIGPERGLVLPPGVTRSRSATRWTSVVPHCPSPLGSLSLTIEPRTGAPHVILEITDVSKASARDPYRLSEPLTIPSGTRIEVSGTAGCSAIAMVPHGETAGGASRHPTGASVHASNGDRLTSLGYWCPMHPETQSDQPGSCPRCAMTLVDYRVDLSRQFEWTVDTGEAPRTGRATTLRFAIRDRASAELVDQFERVHEQDLHVFIVSEDRARFEHVHPVRERDGGFTMAWMPPQAGRFKVYGDFLPRGGSSQLLQQWVVVNGPGANRRAPPPPDTSKPNSRAGLEQTMAGVRAKFESESAVSGDTTQITVVLDDAETGEPVRDLEPYLGSAGHMFVVSSDLDEGLHAHPGATGSSVPSRQTFDVRFSRAGWWNLWLQVKRRAEILTFPFAVEVRPKG